MHYAVDLWSHIAIGLAALAAGLVNSIAGGGSVITFPVLLWAGVPPVTASATNSLGLWPGVVSALFGFRDEIRKSARPELLLVVPSLIGGAIGALVLLSTPSSVFRAIAPWLVLLATGLIAVQEPLSKRLRRGLIEGLRPTLKWWVIGALAQLLIATYGGYFGAGMGILMLATLGLLGFRDIHHMNALKNLYAIVMKGSAIVYLVARGAVDWEVAWVMIGASMVGGFLGAKLAYRLGRPTVRKVVIAIGFVMALSLFLKL